MMSFATGQRVMVLRDDHGIALNAPGTVSRVRGDGGAWIALDRRSLVTKVHPFPADDHRGTHVLAYPCDCEMTTKTRAERRAAQADQVRTAAVTSLDMSMFGRDHWSTFAYVETLCVDGDGTPEKERMRCLDARHPLHAHSDSSAYPTRLKDGTTISQHDDWDCVHDLIVAGLMEDVGSAVNPCFRLTPRGFAVAALLRRHKAEDGRYATFSPTEPSIEAAMAVHAE